jgi:hypothetical protein
MLRYVNQSKTVRDRAVTHAWPMPSLGMGYSRNWARYRSSRG